MEIVAAIAIMLGGILLSLFMLGLAIYACVFTVVLALAMVRLVFSFWYVAVLIAAVAVGVIVFAAYFPATHLPAAPHPVHHVEMNLFTSLITAVFMAWLFWHSYVWLLRRLVARIVALWRRGKRAHMGSEA